MRSRYHSSCRRMHELAHDRRMPTPAWSKLRIRLTGAVFSYMQCLVYSIIVSSPSIITCEHMFPGYMFYRYHPSYHRMHELAREHRVPTLAWTEPRAHLSRAVLSSMQYQLESGAACPLTMVYAVVPALKRWNDRGQFDEWIEKLTASHYDGTRRSRMDYS